ncbi:hypothetical protein QBC47DRAFT_10414 [Echria macrotheca]|uniref:Uncharacterized protein n=1 Tax=Echria macrotheca TaxID=438768 RepID=A0AAJ0BLR0_9PEZI|nr:hypothetical protein QBC47DRAFT_10414 [Echria macrotheca]
MAPPVTPAPSRFLLPSKRSGTQSAQVSSHTPNQPVSTGPRHFYATPRFSSATSRPSNNLWSASTPILPPLSIKTDGPPRTQESIDDESPLESSGTSPTFPTNVQGQLPEPIEFSSSFVSPSHSPATRDDEVHGRSAKRRRISITSSEPEASSPVLPGSPDGLDVDITSSPLQTATPSDVAVDADDILGTSPHDLDSNLNVDSDVDLPIHSSASSTPQSPSSPRPHPQQPTFHAPPRFKPPANIPDKAEETPAQDIFSPQRRGARYVSGGLASELRDWLVEIKENDAEQIRSHAAVRLAVDAVRDGGTGMALVEGRPVDERGVLGPAARVILAGQGSVDGLGGNGSRRHLVPGSVLVINPPAWDVGLDDIGQWAVSYKWDVESGERR